MQEILHKKNFRSDNTYSIAKNLLGKFLVRRFDKYKSSFMITEVEAYDGHRDKASHAHHGKTDRNAPMFNSAGHWYVYFTYGMHWMLNIVTGPKNYPAAILIRGVSEINGPARLTRRLIIDKKFNNKPVSNKTGLWI
ncbi:MAG: DNA-3-methyladenine glycosylase, partial [Patescibacteria group bacterium]